MKNNFLHIYAWLDLPPSNDAERDAKEWLSNFMLPASDRYKLCLNEWLSRYAVTVEWKGRRYICSGASRLGDVWLKSEGSASSYYDHRVYVSELSGWKRIVLPHQL